MKDLACLMQHKSSNLGKSLNRSQHESCSTAYGTPIVTQVVCRRFDRLLLSLSLFWSVSTPRPKKLNRWLGTRIAEGQIASPETPAPGSTFASDQQPPAGINAFLQRASANRHRKERCAPIEARTQRNQPPKEPATQAPLQLRHGKRQHPPRTRNLAVQRKSLRSTVAVFDLAQLLPSEAFRHQLSDVASHPRPLDRVQHQMSEPAVPLVLRRIAIATASHQ